MQDVLISKCLSIRLKIEMEVQGARCKVQAQDLHPVPCTLFPVPCSLHPVPYPVPYTLHPIPSTLTPLPYKKIPEAKPPPGFG